MLEKSFDKNFYKKDNEKKDIIEDIDIEKLASLKTIEEKVFDKLPLQDKKYINGSYRESGLFSRIIEKNPKFRKFIQALAVVTSLVGPVQSVYGYGDKFLESKYIQQEKVNEKELSDEEKEIIKYLGLDEEKLSKNYKISIPVNNGAKGKYIIHIGDYHTPLMSFKEYKQDIELNPFEYQGIFQCQKNLEDLMNYLVNDKGVENIFLEGLSIEGLSFDNNDKKPHLFIKNYVKEIRTEINKIETNPIKSIDIERYFEIKYAFQEIPEGIELHLLIWQALEKKAIEIDNAIKNNNIEKDEITQELAIKYEVERINERWTKSKKELEEILYYGSILLQISIENDSLSILPAEEKEINEKGINIMIKIMEIKRKIRELKLKLEKKLLNNPQIISFFEKIKETDFSPDKEKIFKQFKREKYIKLRKKLINEMLSSSKEYKNDFENLMELETKYYFYKTEFKKWAVEARENVALNIIDSYSKQMEDSKFYPMVYGNAHNWTNNVEEFNKTRNKNYGLIKLTPILNLEKY